MTERKIEFPTEGQTSIAKKNKRDLIFTFILPCGAAITLAKIGAGFFVSYIVILMCVGFPLLMIRKRNVEYHKERTKKSIDALVKQYGNYSLKIDESCIDFMTILFPASQIVIIHGTKFKFSEIIDFSLNEMSSYKTTTSTSSMLGRGLVGGVMFGGIGALAGANSASSKTIKENTQYNFNIILDDFNNPNFRCTYYQEDKATTLYAILKLIIDKNQEKNNG